MHALDVLKYGNLTVLRAIRGLPEPDWHAPGVCGYWSVRDLIAHLASFEHMLVDVLAVAGGGEYGPYLVEFLRSGQAFNDAQVPARSGLSVLETVAEYETVQARTMELAAALPPESFRATGFLPAYGAEYDLEDFIAYTFYGHKREHSAQIAVFRDSIKR
jgi:uncharacterized protein (TIGR03083 family)